MKLTNVLLLVANTLLPITLNAQTYTGESGGGLYSEFIAILAGNSSSDWTINYGGNSSIQATLSPGHITFDSFELSVPAFSREQSVQLVDPNTFQTTTYRVQLNLDAFSYHARSSALPLISGGSTLSFSGNRGWLPEATRLSGSYAVISPTSTVAGEFGVDFQPLLDGPFDLLLDVSDYPRSAVVNLGTTAPYGFEPARLFSTTIDGMTLNYNVTSLHPYLAFGQNQVFRVSAIPEPGILQLSALGALALIISRILNRTAPT